MMNKVHLLLGSNLSDRAQMLYKARTMIRERIGEVMQASSIYESTPWGFIAENNFLNQVLIAETYLQPFEILEKIKYIENELGRKRISGGYESRTIDIDILFYNNETIMQSDLVIPHPQLHKRKFTLLPLNELEPTYQHPALGKSIQVLLNECDDNSVVKIFKAI